MLQKEVLAEKSVAKRGANPPGTKFQAVACLIGFFHLAACTACFRETFGPSMAWRHAEIDNVEKVLDFNGPQVGKRQTVYCLSEMPGPLTDDEFLPVDFDMVPLGIEDEGKALTPDQFTCVSEIDRAIGMTALGCGATKVAKLLAEIEREVAS